MQVDDLRAPLTHLKRSSNRVLSLLFILIHMTLSLLSCFIRTFFSGVELINYHLRGTATII